jgi:DNA (cytosine-5)-methyltransferase 1
VNELALFAGAGGGILGGKLLGWRTVCAVEWEPYPASVLCARQNDGLLPPFPIWDDVQTFDGHPWRGVVDVISGGFPCQDISAAGRGAGIDGERSGMWREMARIIREVRPRYAFVENSPMLTSRGLGVVLGDLASMGFDARWGVLGAADVGANHQRDRIWIVARWRGDLSHAQHDRIRRWEQQQKSVEKETREVSNSNRIGLQRSTDQQELERKRRNQFQTEQSRNPSNVANTINQGIWSCSGRYGEQFNGQDRTGIDNEKRSRIDVELAQIRKSSDMEKEISNSTSVRSQGQGKYEQPICPEKGRNRQTNIVEPIGTSDFWAIEPNVGRVANGVAARVDRLKAIGNGQVPLCAATAFRILSNDL